MTVRLSPGISLISHCRIINPTWTIGPKGKEVNENNFDNQCKIALEKIKERLIDKYFNKLEEDLKDKNKIKIKKT